MARNVQGTINVVIAALQQDAQTPIDSLNIILTGDAVTDSEANVLELNSLMSRNSIESITVTAENAVKSLPVSPYHRLVDGIVSFVNRANTGLQRLDLSNLHIGGLKLVGLNLAMQDNTSVTEIVLSEEDTATVAQSTDATFDNIKSKMVVFQPQDDEDDSDEEASILPAAQPAAPADKKGLSAALASVGNGLLSLVRAIFSPVIKHPILSALTVLFAVAVIVALCVPFVGQALGIAGLSAVATNGIAAGFSTALTYLAATKVGMMVGLAVPSITALAIAAKVALVAVCAIAAASLPTLAKLFGDLLAKGYHALTSVNTNANAANAYDSDDEAAPLLQHDQLAASNADNTSFGAKLASFFRAIFSPVIKHPILSALTVVLGAAVIVALCVPFVGQALGIAGLSAVATNGIAAGFSTALTYLAATKVGMMVGLAVPSMTALAIAAKVALVACCAIVAASLPKLIHMAGSFISEKYAAFKASRSNAAGNHEPIELAPVSNPVSAVLPGQQVPYPAPAGAPVPPAPSFVDTHPQASATPPADALSGTVVLMPMMPGVNGANPFAAASSAAPAPAPQFVGGLGALQAAQFGQLGGSTSSSNGNASAQPLSFPDKVGTTTHRALAVLRGDDTTTAYGSNTKMPEGSATQLPAVYASPIAAPAQPTLVPFAYAGPAPVVPTYVDHQSGAQVPAPTPSNA